MAGGLLESASDLLLAASGVIGDARDLDAVLQALQVAADALLDGRGAGSEPSGGNDALGGITASLLQLSAAPAQLRQAAFGGAAWETWAEVLLSGAHREWGSKSSKWSRLLPENAASVHTSAAATRSPTLLCAAAPLVPCSRRP